MDKNLKNQIIFYTTGVLFGYPGLNMLLNKNLNMYCEIKNDKTEECYEYKLKGDINYFLEILKSNKLEKMLEKKLYKLRQQP